MVHFVSFRGIFIELNFLHNLHTTINVRTLVCTRVQHEFFNILLTKTKVLQITLINL